MTQTSIPFPVIHKERMVVQSGGPFDKTRCYAPSVVERNGEYLMYYTGSNDNPNARSGYRLLLARSRDGLAFEKHPDPVLDMFPEAKCYSAEAHLQDCGCIRLYYAQNDGTGYRIFRTSSEDPVGPFDKHALVVDTGSQFSHSVHTLRILKHDGIYHAYVTGSSNGARSQSQKYKQYRISSDFRIFHATSVDGKEFSDFQEVTFPPHSFINMYGHSVFMRDGVVYLVFTGFDGSAACTLHIAASRDFVTFTEPRDLFQPELEAGEIGMYSTCVVPLAPDTWRLYYASRAAWKYRGIMSATINFDRSETDRAA